MKIQTLKNTTAIHYSSLWDGLSGLLSGPGTLYCKDGYIVDEGDIKDSIEDLDLSGLTLMPGMIDCHIHLMMPYGSTEPLSHRIRNILNSGVIAVRDGGSQDGLTPETGSLHTAYCSQAIYKAGFYGNNLGVAVGNADDALRRIDELKMKDIKHIKIIASGIFSFTEFGKTGPLPFTVDELEQITRYAHAQGLHIMAHASGDEAVRRCVAAGVNSIEHGYFMSEETLEELVRQSIAWVPTLTPVAIHLDNPILCRALSPQQQETVRKSLHRQMQLVKKGAALGARIGAGTDAGAVGVFHGTSLLWEIRHLINCGLSTLLALQAATSVAATISGFTALGSLKPGKQASILAVRGNPLDNPDVLQCPEVLLLPL